MAAFLINETGEKIPDNRPEEVRRGVQKEKNDNAGDGEEVTDA